MEYNVEDIVKEVKIALDENPISNALLLTDTDNLVLEDIIRQKIVDAVRLASLDAPEYRLTDSSNLILENINIKDDYGIGKLPDDFLRLVSFKLDQWLMPGSLILENTQEYLIQKSNTVGLRGSISRPVMAVVTRNDGLFLEYFSTYSTTSASISVAKYIKEPVWDSAVVSMSEGIYRAVIYYAASLTAMTVKDSNAEALMAIAKSHLR